MTVDVLLLHGAWCGGWVWDGVVAELKQRGLRAVAPDLPVDEPSAGIAAYLDAATTGLTPGDVPLVVGHSLAGILLEPLAQRLQVRGLVYLAAFVPRPGEALRDGWRRRPAVFVDGWSRGVQRADDGSSRWASATGAGEVLFGGCPADVAARAMTRLRPQYWDLAAEPFAGTLSTPSTHVVAREDRLLSTAALRDDAAQLLGVESIELPGGHCPMVAHAAPLADLLATVHAVAVAATDPETQHA